jgi:hypothetical protein
METDASKENNNFLLLLILPIYAVLVGVAIDFSPLSNSNKKKVSQRAPLSTMLTNGKDKLLLLLL